VGGENKHMCKIVFRKYTLHDIFIFLNCKSHMYLSLVIVGPIIFKKRASKTLNWRLFNISNYLQAI